MGYVYLQQDKSDLAIEYFKKCLFEDDQISEANLNLALVYYKSGDEERAKYYMEQEKELAQLLQEGMDGFIGLKRIRKR